MPSKSIRLLLPVLALIAGIAAAACGTVATPEWAAEAQATNVALAATSDHLTAIAPTATFTSTPTDTPVPTATPTTAPTDTPVPPTATPAPPTATPVPPTAASTAEASSGEPGLAERVAAADPANGQVIFNTPHQVGGATWACAQCHSVTPDQARIIGPGLWDVSVREPTYGLDETPIEYIHNSIVAPSDFIAPAPADQPPFPDMLMPHGFLDTLGESQIDDLVAYLMTLHD